MSTNEQIELITNDKLFHAIRDVIKELINKGFEIWQIEEYLKYTFEDAEYFIDIQLTK